MTLHRTPMHHLALGLVRDRKLRWSPNIGVSGGFTHHTGQRCDPPLLVALWEMRGASLLDVQGETVALTVAGRQRLSRWDRGDHGA